MTSLFEHLPNELIYDVFQYLDTRDLYYGFWRLNSRLNAILRSLRNLSLTMDKNDPALISVFSPRVVQLKLNTWHEIDLTRFSKLRVLILQRTTRFQVAQIRPHVIPYLRYLSLSLAFDFWSSAQLAEDVFSNGFPLLRYADLGRVDVPYTRSWSLSPHLLSVCVCSGDPIIIPLILVSCPYLRSLQVQVFGDNHHIDLPTLRLNHPLKRFTFVDSYGVLSLSDMSLLLSYVLSVEYIHLTLFEISFTRLASILNHHLHRLKTFDCYIHDSAVNADLDEIRAMNPCFERIQYYEKSHGVRYFTNKQL
ncbi:unnamed protein product [Adineta ricciae]|uniref:F-box domain-containing protein n=1 Tax=Adineta ricciae TaxID=249248 RepID=A0A815EZ18_ADIRI|nr:unnamed protein product [Adineta ricciae]CAF1359571.1 unnamed protein product [Adineta ricciae]